MAAAAALVMVANPIKSIRLHPLRRRSTDIYLTTSCSNLRCCPPMRKKGFKLLEYFFSEFKKKPAYLTKSDQEKSAGESRLHPRHVNLWESWLRALRKSAIGAVLLGLLVTYNPKSNPALAAPIRRVGGSWSKKVLVHEYEDESNPEWGSSCSSSSSSTINEEFVDDPCPVEVATLYFLLFCVAGPIFLYLWNELTSYFFYYDSKLLHHDLPLVLLICLAFVFCHLGWRELQTCASVIKVQVHLSDTGSALQTDLNRIAESVDADTNSYKSLTYVLNETVVAMLRRRNGHYFSGYSSAVLVPGGRAARFYLNYLSIRERMPHEETDVNVNSMKLQSSTSHSSTNESQSEQIVVTILVAAKGKFDIPAISDRRSLNQVLRILVMIGLTDRIRGVEVLWTPQPSSSPASVCNLPAA